MKRFLKMVVRYGTYVRCKYCGRDCSDVGSGQSIRGMCERCYENGGDDE